MYKKSLFVLVAIVSGSLSAATDPENSSGPSGNRRTALEAVAAAARSVQEGPVYRPETPVMVGENSKPSCAPLPFKAI